MRPSSPIFVQRQTYRSRRLMDAARLLPLLGACLFAVPLLWPDEDGGAIRTSRAMIYIFGVWTLLIVATALLSRRLGRDGDDGGSGAE
ncbi:MAG: hypothetical protein ACLFQL_08955 [Paracoccaceae bacterium]